jgi:hypothetical protein
MSLRMVGNRHFSERAIARDVPFDSFADFAHVALSP